MAAGEVCMFPKLVVMVWVAVGVGAVQLDLRQQRIEIMHEMAVLHGRMDTHRRKTWDLQVRIASFTQPMVLRDAIARAQLLLQPDLPGAVPVPPSVARGDWP